MGTFRIYPSKSNTLVEKNPTINTGLNEVTELWYGDYDLTRHLIQFDFDDYNTQYALGFIPHITGTTATFKIFPTYPIYEETIDGAELATSFDLEVQIMQQAWDEGIGHIFDAAGKQAGFSCWNSATTTTAWTSPGGDYLYQVFSGHVDVADEIISLGITDEVELWNTFTGSNFGLILKYTDEYEALTGSTKQIAKYFTKNTHTYQLPYIEFTWDDQVKDERDEVGHELTKRLYFYLKKSGVFASANDISGVTIDYATPQFTDELYPSSAITEQYPGVYYIEFTAPPWGTPGQEGTGFEDTWHVQLTSGAPYTEITLSGDLHADVTQWNYDQTDVLEAVEYKILMPNLAKHYHRGNIIYLDVAAYEQYTSTRVVVKNMEYTINLLDDGNPFTMVDWSPVSYTRDINGFPLNTSWFLVDQTYEIEFRYSVNGAVSKTSDDKFKFRVVE